MKIGITNLKGGVGKTTLSINLAVCLAHRGHSVCIIDTDENRNSLQWHAARDESHPAVLVVGSVDPKGVTKAVDSLNQQYDFVIMDGTPNLGEMSTRIIFASDLLIIPVRPGGTDFRAMNEFIKRLDEVKQIKGEVQATFVVNEYNDKVSAYKQIKNFIVENYEVPMMESIIKSRVAYVESYVNGTGVLEHSDPKAKVEIENFTNEMLKIHTPKITTLA